MAYQKRNEKCKCCGGKVVDYRENLNSPLIKALHKLARHPDGVNIRSIGLADTEWSNFCKLKYWNFVVNVKKGIWHVTEEGYAFLRSELTVQKIAWSFRGDVVAREGAEIRVEDIYDGFDKIEDYIRYRKPHQPGQMPLGEIGQDASVV